MDEAKVIGKNLKEARRAAGFTQQQVAEIMLKLCKLYKITASDLFGI